MLIALTSLLFAQSVLTVPNSAAARVVPFPTRRRVVFPSFRRAPTPLDPLDIDETDDVVFAFGGEMTPNEGIAQVEVQCRSIGDVVDSIPGEFISTPHQVIGTDVVQRLARNLEGARYIVRVKATMNTGRVFVAAAHVPIVKL